MTVKDPSTFLAFFAAVFRASAAPTLGELPGVFFPFPALVVCALADPASAVVFPA